MKEQKQSNKLKIAYRVEGDDQENKKEKVIDDFNDILKKIENNLKNNNEKVHNPKNNNRKGKANT